MSRPRETSDEQLLEAARAVFLEHGPAVGTRLIAERAGVSQATLFKRFGSKEELLLAAMRPEAPLVFERLDTLPPVAPQLRELLAEMTAFFFRLMPRLAVLKAAGLEPRDLFPDGEEPPPIRARRLLAAWLSRLVDEGHVRPIDADAVALALIGAVCTPAMRAHVLGEEPPEPQAYAVALADLFWAGMKP